MNDLERRLLAGAQAELRASTAGQLAGYAAVFNRLSEDLGGFREVLLPGAFDRALRERQPVVALFNHDPDHVLGRTSNGTLTLAVDARGLKAEMKPPATPTAAEVTTLVRGGYVGGMSFAFRVPKGGDRWRSDPAGYELREVHDLDLFDVSVVTTPAYADTTVSARARSDRAQPNEMQRLRLMIS